MKSLMTLDKTLFRKKSKLLNTFALFSFLSTFLPSLTNNWPHTTLYYLIGS